MKPGGYTCKVYIVQRADGTVVGAKLAFEIAHQLAKAHAPAKILFSIADKSLQPNVMEHAVDQSNCK